MLKRGFVAGASRWVLLVGLLALCRVLCDDCGVLCARRYQMAAEWPGVWLAGSCRGHQSRGLMLGALFAGALAGPVVVWSALRPCTRGAGSYAGE